MRKLKHKTVVSTLNDIHTEASYNAESGDPRLAASGRQLALLTTIVLQLVSDFPEEQFNAINLASYTEKDVSEEVAEDTPNESETDNSDT